MRIKDIKPGYELNESYQPKQRRPPSGYQWAKAVVFWTYALPFEVALGLLIAIEVEDFHAPSFSESPLVIGVGVAACFCFLLVALACGLVFRLFTSEANEVIAGSWRLMKSAGTPEAQFVVGILVLSWFVCSIIRRIAKRYLRQTRKS
jgi:hypothetical protein